MGYIYIYMYIYIYTSTHTSIVHFTGMQKMQNRLKYVDGIIEVHDARISFSVHKSV